MAFLFLNTIFQMTAFYFTLTFTPPHLLPLTQSCAPSLLADSAAAARFLYFNFILLFKEAVSLRSASLFQDLCTRKHISCEHGQNTQKFNHKVDIHRAVVTH